MHRTLQLMIQYISQPMKKITSHRHCHALDVESCNRLPLMSNI